MAKILAFANHKGGVGKTTSVLSIGANLAARGYKTLLVDLDAQSNLTLALGYRVDEQRRSIYEALTDRKELPIISVRDNLYLTPSSLYLAGVELQLSSAISREYIIKDLLDPISGDFDFILLDCPPSLGLITINALAAADELYLPLTAEMLPLSGVALIQQTIALTQQRLNKDLKLAGIFFTRYLGRRLNKEVVAVAESQFGEIVFKTKVRENIEVAAAPSAGMAISEYAPKSNGAKDYAALTDELLSRISIK